MYLLNSSSYFMSSSNISHFLFSPAFFFLFLLSRGSCSSTSLKHFIKCLKYQSNNKQEAHRPWCSGCGACNAWPQMILTCSRSKIPTCILHTPLRSKFSSLSLYDEPFLSHGPIFRKVHRMTQMTLTCSRSKYQHACYAHPPLPLRGPNFCPSCSTMSRSWVTQLFRKSSHLI